MSAVMPQRTTKNSQSLIHRPSLTLVNQSERLVKIETEIIAHLSESDSEEVIQTRLNAKMLSDTAWRIECACDYYIISTTKKAKYGRRRKGAGDTENSGITAAVRKQAQKVGVTPQTIFKNAQIHRLITEAENTLPEMTTSLRVLNERKYFVIALMAADPLAALQLFVDKKRVLKRFRTTDAERLIHREGLTKKSVSSTAIDQARATISELSNRSSELLHITKTIELIKNQVIPECSNEDIRRIHEGYVEELNSYMTEDLFDQDICIALTRAWMLGNHDEAQLSKATGIPIEVVSREMGLLGAKEKFIEVPGPGPRKWHRVGSPLPAELTRRIS